MDWFNLFKVIKKRTEKAFRLSDPLSTCLCFVCLSVCRYVCPQTLTLFVYTTLPPCDLGIGTVPFPEDRTSGRTLSCTNTCSFSFIYCVYVNWFKETKLKTETGAICSEVHRKCVNRKKYLIPHGQDGIRQDKYVVFTIKCFCLIHDVYKIFSDRKNCRKL